jgi:ADP-ribose pyrophosphatase
MFLRLIEKQILYAGKKVRLEVHRLEDEETGTMHVREVAVHPGAVVILPFLSEDEVILIRNQRYSIGQTLIELPAGTLEKGEDPMNCAGRELQEETGYLAHRIKPIHAFFSSPGVLTEKLYAYAAYDLKKSKQALEADEQIEIMPVKFEEALEMIRSGQIMDGKTIATLLMFDKFHRSGKSK